MYIGHHAASSPDRIAAVMWPSGDHVTFAQLYARSTQLANYLRAAGLQPGDHIAVFSYNHVGYYEAVWAGLNSGLYVTTVNAHSTADEAAYVINDCEARVLVVSDATAAVAEQLVADTPGVEIRLTVDASAGSYTAIDEVIADQPSTPTGPERRGTYMLYSSGTTGRPKGIKPALPDAPAADGDALEASARLMFALDEGSVYLSPAPLHHAAPLRVSVNAQAIGATVVCMERFDPEQALAAIQHHGVTASQWVPTMFIRMLKLPEAVRESYDLATHRRAVHAAAPCPIWAKEQMIEWWGPIISEYYSGSENIGTTSIESAEWLAHKGSVGRPVFGEIHICDEAGTELPAGEDGLIYFFAPETVFEYHGDAGKTASMYHPTQPWRTLGDIGHLDSDGYLYLSDRATFMIISGGVNIYPQEIENLLLEHPGVTDAAVVGIPHDDLGEVPLAVVQPSAEGATIADLPEVLREFCRSRLSSYKVPVRVELRAELPRGEDGKLRKRPLRAEYWPATGSGLIAG